MIKHQLEIRVTDAESQPVEGATVTLNPETIGEPATAAFDETRQLYFIDGLRPGFFKITLAHPDFQSQEKRIQVHPKPTPLSFVLTSPGTSHTFRGETRVPYHSEPELLGIIPNPDMSAEDEGGPTLEGLLAGLGLVPEVPAQEDEGPGRLVLSSAEPLTPAAIVVRRTQTPETLESDEAEVGGSDLKALRESPLVEAAGPIFHRSGEGFSVFTNRMMVRFLPEVTIQEARRLIQGAGLSLVSDVTYSPNLFLCEADASVGEEINVMAERLMNTGRVLYAEPNVAESPEPDAVVPRDYLWDGTWDRQLVKTPEAWQRLRDAVGEDAQFGRHNVVIAVVDSGLKSTGGVPDNPDFNGTVSDGSSKVYKLFSFAHMTANNDTPIGNFPDHGVACAGVAAGLANNFATDPEVGVGIAGAAPNARLIGLIYPASETLRLEMFIWAAGLNARSSRPNFPAPINPGADIFSCSMGFGTGSPLSNAARDMFDYITSRGRGGRGCVALFSAGNDNLNIENFRPYGAYERSFSCAASTLDPAGNEIRAPYSGWGRVAWCAPSNSHAPPMQPHNPPNSYATWTASFLGLGNLPSFPDATTTLVAPASAGATSITVASVNGIRNGMFILIGEPGRPGSEPVRVTAAPDPATNRVRVKALLNNHAALEEVAAGSNHHRNSFGGTSSATPLAAGVCALVLSAQPDLTWVEVREILRATAVKFDTENTDPVGRWLDEDGVPSVTSGRPPVFSQWYGFGRLDADAAVAAALAYTFPRDLMIRKSLEDTGEQAAAPSADSPDIWVRNADPAIDEGALPSGFAEAGPHQEPRAGGGRWIYARIRNRGTEPSFDAWAHFYVASFGATPPRHPEDWEPMNGLGNIAPDAWVRGTYLIGEVALPSIGAGEDLIVNIHWPDELMPPTLDPLGVPWNPHILVEVTPHDGPLAGAGIHENNNLAAKSVTVGDAPSPIENPADGGTVHA